MESTILTPKLIALRVYYPLEPFKLLDKPASDWQILIGEERVELTIILDSAAIAGKMLNLGSLYQLSGSPLKLNFRLSNTLR